MAIRAHFARSSTQGYVSSTKQVVLAALSEAGDSPEAGQVPEPRASGYHLILPANVHSGHPRYRAKSRCTG
jgi:hypothetical protein